MILYIVIYSLLITMCIQRVGQKREIAHRTYMSVCMVIYSLLIIPCIQRVGQKCVNTHHI